jgi:catechol 2,3-dioxygenase-like lactoylglutathione lyase family enzyme
MITQTHTESATQIPTATTVDLKLEVVVIPVSDVERAKRFYEGLGWRLDGDFVNGDRRAVQFTPPGSPCSIHFGTGLTKAVPGSAQGLFLVVDDIEAARAELTAKGVGVTEPFYFAEILGAPLPGLDPKRHSYATHASFSDPDGNSWLLQEVKTRLPGRGFSNLDVPTLTELLREAEEHHGKFEPIAPKHHWSDFYSAFIVAREQGQTAEAAAKAGAQRVAAVATVAAGR